MRRLTLALSLTGLIAISPFSSTQAAPLTALSAAAGPTVHISAVQDNLTQVRWRGGWGIGAGLLAGALIGSAIAAPYYGEYPPYYGYRYPYARYGGYYPAYTYTPYGSSYGWGPQPYAWGPRPWRYSYGWSAPRPWGYTVRRAHPWRHSYGWAPRPYRHHHGVIRAHHRW
ncbi:hypothetical protein ACVWWK_002590 [Bradyrhizobium sp. LB9.1b]